MFKDLAVGYFYTERKTSKKGETSVETLGGKQGSCLKRERDVKVSLVEGSSIWK